MSPLRKVLKDGDGVVQFSGSGSCGRAFVTYLLPGSVFSQRGSGFVLAHCQAGMLWRWKTAWPQTMLD